MADKKNAEITALLSKLKDWRGENLSKLRALIASEFPGLHEEWKWSSPVWANDGNLLAYGIFKDHVRLNFFEGERHVKTKKYFNVGLEAKKSRGIEYRQGDAFDLATIKAVIGEAMAIYGHRTQRRLSE